MSFTTSFNSSVATVASPTDKSGNEVAKAIARELCRIAAAGAQGLSSTHFLQAYQQPAAIIRAMAPAHRSAAVQALQRLRTFRDWRDNWDAEGAPAPDQGALNAASIILGYLRNYPIDPTAMLDADGKPMLILRYPGGEGEINVLSDATLDYVMPIPGRDTEYEADVHIDAAALPQQLQDVLQRLQAVLA